jgi:GNAT superfamily N-acetyltransferase
VRLRDGQAIVVRPFVRGDAPSVIEGFRRLSPESRRRRFFISTPDLPPDVIRRLVDVDQDRHVVLVAVTATEALPVGGARYARHDDERARAELAVTVADHHQGRGVGAVLLSSIIDVALANGIDVLDGHVLDENEPMRALLRNAGATFSFDEAGVLAFELDVTHAPPARMAS